MPPDTLMRALVCRPVTGCSGDRERRRSHGWRRAASAVGVWSSNWDIRLGPYPIWSSLRTVRISTTGTSRNIGNVLYAESEKGAPLLPRRSRRSLVAG